jgi:hypothetical protein
MDRQTEQAVGNLIGAIHSVDTDKIVHAIYDVVKAAHDEGLIEGAIREDDRMDRDRSLMQAIKDIFLFQAASAS